MSDSPPDPALVRAMVRELVDELRAEPDSERAQQSEIVVRIQSDAELAAFVIRLAGLLDDPATGSAIRAGQIRFRIDRGASAGAADELRLERGVLTEKLVSVAAREGRRVVLGRGAIVTPLARDRARAVGITIERES